MLNSVVGLWNGDGNKWHGYKATSIAIVTNPNQAETEISKAEPQKENIFGR